MHNSYKLLAILCLIFGTLNALIAQPVLDRIKLTSVFTGLDNPVGMARCGDDRIFIIEQSGIIKIGYPDGTILDKPFLDISDRVNSGGEKGLLGLAFPENFKSTGDFFVNYTAGIQLKTVISRFKISQDSNVALPGLERVILEIDQPYSNHNGGCIQFGPDGYLYIGMGDGGAGGDPDNQSQNKTSLLGKMLRIDVSSGNSYEVPDSNPFYFDESYAPEIWSLGLRNPWKFSFDPHEGHMWIAEVGQNEWEEVDFESASEKGGLNYGWRCYEGFEEYNTDGCGDEDDYVFPAAVMPHSGEGNCSITGGEVFVSNPASDLYGGYLSTDYCSGRFWITKQDTLVGFVTTQLYDSPFGGFTGFGYDASYNIYVARNNGAIYRIDTIEQCVPSLQITASKDTLECFSDTILLTTQQFQFGQYRWYKDGDLIPNSVTDSIYITEQGDYEVQFLSDSCVAFTLQPLRISKANTIPTEIVDLPTQYCISGEPLELNGLPLGGHFEGTGVTDNVFYPAESGLGTFLITYYYEDNEGCIGYSTQNIKVNKIPNVNILNTEDSLCFEGAPLALVADSTEGRFYGIGVTGSVFYPQVSGIGTHTIYFEYEPWQGCITTDSINVVVYMCILGTHKIREPLFTISPNPAQNQISIKLTGISENLDRLEIIDLNGKTVKNLSNLKSSGSSLNINVLDLVRGTYIVRGISGNKYFTERLILH